MWRILFRVVCRFVLFLVVFSAMAQEMPEKAGSKEVKPGTPPPIRDLGDGLYQIGGVRLNKESRTVMFNGSVNMNKGLVEYLLVGVGGKTHESVFATVIEPYHLHVAMLLLGAKGSQIKEGTEPPPAVIDDTYLKNAPDLNGDRVSISVKWKIGDKVNEAKAEDFLVNGNDNTPMSGGAWIYSGSMLQQGRFLAQEELSIAALVTDPIALINIRRPGRDGSQTWEADPKKTPPSGTPVEFVVTLEQPENIDLKKP